MPAAAVDAPSSAPLEPLRPARLWPAVALVAIYWTVWIASWLADMTMFQRFVTRFWTIVGVTLLYLIWWVTSRRLPLRDRFLVIGAVVAVILAVWALLDPSFNRLQLIVAFYAMPVMLTAWTAWLLARRSASRRTIRRGMVALAVVAWAWALALRLDGMAGEANPIFRLRWTPTGEEQFLAASRAKPADAAPPAEAPGLDPPPADPALGDWPEFRGPRRDGAVHGVKLAVNWNESPPKQLWKRRVGPGWSSIVVVGKRLFTQEQRGPNEVVVCYHADTGDELWSHEDATRFSESMGGDGPRATPTYASGRLYALGATGILNCLDPAAGQVLWSHDISKAGQAADGKSSVPMWGYSSSPLVVDGKVIVFAGGGGDYAAPPSEKSAADSAPEKPEKEESGESADHKPDENTLLAFDAATGDLAWRAPAGHHSYSSAQLAEIDGQKLVLFLGDIGLSAFDPADGALLWKLPTTAKRSMPSLQPHRLDDSRWLVSFSADEGTVEAEVTHDGDKWQVHSSGDWKSRDMKPFFNDMVRTGGALYGFDGSIFASIDADTGKRNWKKGRYGSGQVLLVADQPLLLVISEAGEAVLVAAIPERHEELGRFAALEGKTWNHPVIAHGRLYVRNAEEMACYQLELIE